MLKGTIVTETVVPLTYDSTSGQTSSYLVNVTASVKLVAHDGAVLYKNDAFAWREQYQSTQDFAGLCRRTERRCGGWRRTLRRRGERHAGELSMSETSGLKSFAGVERFLAEVSGDARRAGYVLLGDDAFLMEMCRKGVMQALVPEEMKDFCLHDLDLGQTSIFEALDLAQTPSLMAPFQVLFLRNVKTLYGRGQKKEEFKAIDEYFRRPNPRRW